MRLSLSSTAAADVFLNRSGQALTISVMARPSLGVGCDVSLTALFDVNERDRHRCHRAEHIHLRYKQTRKKGGHVPEKK